MRPAVFALVALPLLPSPCPAEVSFEKEVLPILEAKCVKCHQAPFEENGRTVKPKAGLRLDAAWAIQTGSENGAVLVAGQSGESALYQRVSLPADDDDVMPPKDKADPLTPDEIDRLKRWIDEGAKFGDWQGKLEGKPAELTIRAAPVPLSETQKHYERLATGLEALEETAWEPVKAAGGRVFRLSTLSPLLAVDFRTAEPPATDEQILSVRSLGRHLAHLDLSRTAATDGALALLAETPNLVRLDLSGTTIGDGALAPLKSLKEIRYLNLHGTQVSDAGLDQLKGLRSLEAVYLWQSKATEAGVKKLRQALPDAKIHLK